MRKDIEEIISYKSRYSKERELEARKILDNIAKPLGAMGDFENTIASIAGGLNDSSIKLQKTALIVMCADNGVVKEGVSQSDSSVTANIVRSVTKGTSSVAVMARYNNTDVYVVDVGVNWKGSASGLLIKNEILDIEDGNVFIDENLRAGTGNILNESAMSVDEAISAIMVGVKLVKKLKEEGYELIATGEAGIGNTTTTAALSSVLLGIPVDKVTGRGAGLSTTGLRRKKEVIERTLIYHNLVNINSNNIDGSEAIRILSKIGGLDIAGLVGVFLGGLLYSIPIVMDGVISAISAYISYLINPNTKDYIIASHCSSEPAMEVICKALCVKPVINANMHLGEGTGAVLMISLLKNAICVYNEAARFEDIDVEQYVKQ